MSDVDLGTARGKIELSIASFMASLAQAKAAAGGFFGGVSKASSVLNKTGIAMGGAGLAIVGTLAGATIAAASFEKQISAIGAVSGASEKQLEAMRKKALQLGADTQFSAGEAAQAMEELVKAGVSITDVLNGAADATVNLAAAGGVDMPTAATLAANAMNAFNLKAQDMTGVVDAIAGAANASAIDVGEFGMALQQVGAVANLAGISFNDTATAIALMGNAGIKGSDAGTSIKTMLQNLIPVTDKQIALSKKLGLITKDGANAFFDEHGKAKSMAEISGVLQKALAGMSKEQKLNALNVLFGSDAMRGAAVMADAGAKGFNKMQKAMGNVTAAEVAKKRMDNLAGAFEMLKGSIETAMIQAGTPMQGILTGVVNKITGMVNAFAKLSPATQSFIIKLAGVVAGLLIAGGGFLLVLVQVAKFIDAWKKVNTAMNITSGIGKAAKAMRALNLTFLTNPIVLIVVALIALGVALYVLYKKSATFRAIVQSLWGAIKSGVKVVVSVAKTIYNALKTAFTFVINKAKEVINFFKADWKRALFTLANAPLLLLIAAFKAFGPKILAALKVAGVAILNFVKSLPNKIAFALGFIVGSFIKLHITLTQWALRLGIMLVKFIGNALAKLPRLTARALVAMLSFFRSLPGRIWNFLVMAAVKVSQFEIRVAKAAIQAGKGLVSGVVNFVKSLPSRLWNLLVAAINAVLRFRQRVIDTASTIGKGIYNGVVNGIRALPGAVSGILGSVISAIKSKITEAFNAVKGFAKSMWDGFKKGLGINSPSLIEKQMFQMVDTMDKTWGQIKGNVKSLRGLSKTLPDMSPSLALAGAPTASGTSYTVSIALEVNAYGTATPGEIKQAVKSPDVLGHLVKAARAGSKNR